VSCSLIMWSWLKLCSATADLLGCASLMSIVFFDSELDRSTALSKINPAAFTWDAVYTGVLNPTALAETAQYARQCS
jgi:hypothetical protein